MEWGGRHSFATGIHVAASASRQVEQSDRPDNEEDSIGSAHVRGLVEGQARGREHCR